MGRRHDEQVALTRELLRSVGIETEVDRRGKHPKVRWTHGGREYSISCAVSPSDYRGLANCRTTVRRMLRKLGMDLP